MADEPATRRVCLGMPGYGSLTAGAAIGFLYASSGFVTVRGERSRLAVSQNYNDGSLLAHNFNALWCTALNQNTADEPLDYFAMLHADVEPQRHWLDGLIEEMEDRDLDVLGVVVPIKDQNGLTSIALDKLDGSSWSPECRLTMREVYQLPETFTADDVGRPLLLNTGCWVCRFNPDWAEEVRFTINDRIVRSQTTGKWQADVEPEDWNFSRQCNALGLRLGCTRKVPVQHAGHIRYSNTEPWGAWPCDLEFVPESILPHPQLAESAAILLEA